MPQYNPFDFDAAMSLARLSGQEPEDQMGGGPLLSHMLGGEPNVAIPDLNAVANAAGSQFRTPIPANMRPIAAPTGSVYAGMDPREAARMREMAMRAAMSPAARAQRAAMKQQGSAYGAVEGPAFRSRNPQQAAMDAQVAADFKPMTRNDLEAKLSERFNEMKVDPNIGADVIAQGQWAPNVQAKLFAMSGSDGRVANIAGTKSTPYGQHPLDAEAAANRMAVARSTGMVNPTVPLEGIEGQGDKAQYFANRDDMPLPAAGASAAIQEARRMLGQLPPADDSGTRAISIGDVSSRYKTADGQAAARAAALRNSPYFQDKVKADKLANSAGMWWQQADGPRDIALAQSTTTPMAGPTLSAEQVEAGRIKRLAQDADERARWALVQNKAASRAGLQSPNMTSRDQAMLELAKAQANGPFAAQQAMLNARAAEFKERTGQEDRRYNQSLKDQAYKEMQDARKPIDAAIDRIELDPGYLSNPNPALTDQLNTLKRNRDRLIAEYGARFGGPLSTALQESPASNTPTVTFGEQIPGVGPSAPRDVPAAPQPSPQQNPCAVPPPPGSHTPFTAAPPRKPASVAPPTAQTPPPPALAGSEQGAYEQRKVFMDASTGTVTAEDFFKKLPENVRILPETMKYAVERYGAQDAQAGASAALPYYSQYDPDSFGRRFFQEFGDPRPWKDPAGYAGKALSGPVTLWKAGSGLLSGLLGG